MSLAENQNNEYQDILSTEDCVLGAFDSIKKESEEEIIRRYGKWYLMTDEERWEYLHIANMAYYVH